MNPFKSKLKDRNVHRIATYFLINPFKKILHFRTNTCSYMIMNPIKVIPFTKLLNTECWKLFNILLAAYSKLRFHISLKGVLSISIIYNFSGIRAPYLSALVSLVKQYVHATNLFYPKLYVCTLHYVIWFSNAHTRNTCWLLFPALYLFDFFSSTQVLLYQQNLNI